MMPKRSLYQYPQIEAVRIIGKRHLDKGLDDIC